METLIAAVFVLFLMLFAGLSLSQSSIDAQQTVQAAVSEMENRRTLEDETHLATIEAHTTDLGATILITLANDGEQPIMDFDQWDVILQYSDDLTSYHIDWLPNDSATNAWTLGAIMMNLEGAEPVAEMYNRNILDPGEAVTLTLRISPAAEAGTGILVRVITPNGVTSTTMLASNYAPNVDLNTGLTFVVGETVTIPSSALHTSDQDGDEILYTIVSQPSLGMLSFVNTFTQTDIAAGRLIYTHNGTVGLDGFNFTVSDGKDSRGPYTFSLNATEPPLP